MIYLEKENGLTFSSQTHLRTDENMFRLDTTSSNDVNARYTVTTGEKTSEQSVDDSTKKAQYIYMDSKHLSSYLIARTDLVPSWLVLEEIKCTH